MRRRLWLPAMFCLIASCEDPATAVPAQSRAIQTPDAPLAKIAKNTIDPSGVLTKNGLLLKVTGPIACTAGEIVELRVTVTQRTTGAVAEGYERTKCTGNDQVWSAQLLRLSREAFEAGPAIAVAVARTFDRGRATDAHQWLVNMNLAE